MRESHRKSAFHASEKHERHIPDARISSSEPRTSYLLQTLTHSHQMKIAKCLRLILFLQHRIFILLANLSHESFQCPCNHHVATPPTPPTF
mmetsp:Transcript_1516/g.5193  ORF Transcript_1516/g.5193 Transcript_1516/m.5193 type:complete len:91 (+) Transcript_1516:3766-4038(+)